MKIRFGRRIIRHGLALAAMLIGTANFLAGDSSDRNNQFDFALIGDVPYTPTGVTLSGKPVQTYPALDYNALIADINNHAKVAFTVHVGDIKGGSSWCVGGNLSKDPPITDIVFGTNNLPAADVYTTNVGLFNTLANAAIYAPGDNEWTDCHRNNNGFYNPQERLAYLRTVFFTSPQSLGQKPITLTRQGVTTCEVTPVPAGSCNYPENVLWRYGNILFVVINQPGSNNNHQRNLTNSSLYTVPITVEDPETEYKNRNAANINWVNAAFDAAAADPNTKAVIIMQQANVFERFLEPGQGYTESGYARFVTTLRNRTITYGRPVLLVGGDTHTVRIDKPLTAVSIVVNGVVTYTHDAKNDAVGFPGPSVTTTTLFNTLTGATCTIASATCVAPTRVQNFTRVEVFGSPDVAWIRSIVDPFDPNVFSFATQTIAGTGHGRDGRTDDDDLQ